MGNPAHAKRREAELLATASLHRTPAPAGDLQWQHWGGNGPTLLLLHGGFGSWNHWFANIETLRNERNLWTLDLPGLGESCDMDSGASPREFARILYNGIDDLWGDAREFELAGFSFGAMIGARLAELAGPRCRRFTAIGSAGFGDLHRQVPLEPPPAADTPWREAEKVHRANLRALMFSRGFEIDTLAVYLHAHNLARFRFNSRALSLTDDFLLALPAIADRLLAVWGSEDATAGGTERLEVRRELLEAAGARFVLLEGVGHWAMYEAPDSIDRLLLAR